MIEKIASYNRLSDKGMELIVKIAQMNKAIKGMITDSSYEYSVSVTKISKELESAISDYQSTVIDSFTKLASLDEESEDINVMEDESGFKL